MSSAGQWIQQASMGWVVYDITGSASLLGAVNGVRSIPQLLLAPVADAAADRVSKRMLIFGGEALLVVITMGLALGLATDRVVLWHLFLFTILAGVAMVFGNPVRQALAFDLVPKRAIPNAISLITAASSFTRILGPSIAGYMIAYLGPEGSFFTKAAAHFGVMITVLMIAIPQSGRRERPRGSFTQEIVEGLSYVAKEPAMRLVVALMAVAPLLLIPSIAALMPIFAKDIFKTDAAGLGVLLSSIAPRPMFGALFTASLGRFERRGLLSLVALFGFAIGVLAFALSPNMWVALPCLMFAGFAEMSYMTTNQTALQLLAPGHLRGRVASLMMLTPVMISVGSLVAGVGADIAGTREYAVGSAFVAIGLGVLLLVAAPRLRNLRLSQMGLAGRQG